MKSIYLLKQPLLMVTIPNNIWSTVQTFPFLQQKLYRFIDSDHQSWKEVTKEVI